MPPQSQDLVANVANQGFLAGLNDALLLGALLCFAGAVLALWLVREREIEREPVEPEQPQSEPGSGAVPESAPA